MKHPSWLVLSFGALCSCAWQMQMYQVSALSTTFSPDARRNPLASNRQDDNDNRRVFVGGLTTCDSSVLRTDLETRFGTIEDIFILRETSANPYAFVHFCDAQTAAQAIAGSSRSRLDDSSDASLRLYKEIKPAQPIDPRQKSSQRFERTQQDYREKQKIAQESTTIIQVQRSHLNRLESFLQDRSIMSCNAHQDDSKIKTTGSCRETASKTVALLGVKADDTHQLQQLLDNLPFPVRGVNKLYSTDPKYLVTGPQAEAFQQCAKQMKSIVVEDSNDDDDDDNKRWKLSVFPPSILPDMIGFLQQDEPHLLNRLSPTESTHTLHLVHIPAQDKTNFWLMGITPTQQPVLKSQGQRNSVSIKNSQSIEDLVCRAQSKLQEAFYRYTTGPLPDCIMPSGADKRKDSAVLRQGIAVDCGAAPGGWTQFIVDQSTCGRIYSIDPGDLDPGVAQHSSVIHLRAKVEIAMEELQTVILNQSGETQNEQQQQHVQLWVSDMCLHYMSEQVDIFLEAQRRGIVGEGTFFVLTLKCKVGHSDEAFDQQVALQTARLEATCHQLQTMHLFSNRSGERTVMGYAKTIHNSKKE